MEIMSELLHAVSVLIEEGIRELMRMQQQVYALQVRLPSIQAVGWNLISLWTPLSHSVQKYVPE